jgi:hypothetical protein
MEETIRSNEAFLKTASVIRSFAVALVRDARAQALLVAAISLIALTLFYIVIFGQVQRESDFASSFLAGRDMFAGNWRLEGWWLPPDSFWLTDVPLYGLAGLVFGLRPEVLLYVPAFLWAALTVSCCAVAVRGEGRNRFWALPVVLTLIGLPLFRSSAVMVQATYAPMHVASLILILVMFVLADKAIEDGIALSKARLSCFGAATFVALIGDPLVMVAGVLPVLGAAICSRRKGLTSCFVVGGTVVLSSAMAGIALKLNEDLGGFHVVQADALSLAFASYPQFIANISYVFQNTLHIFGAWFFDSHAARMSPELLRLVLFMVALATVCVAVNSGLKEVELISSATLISVRGSPLTLMLAMGILLDVGATLVSRATFDDYSAARYLFPTLVFGTILVARQAANWRLVGIIGIAAAVASTFAVVHTYSMGPRHMVAAQPRILELAAWLKEHDCTKGYGPYNTSAIITTLTEGEVTIRPVVRTWRSVGIDELRWLTSAIWYPTPFSSRKPGFVIVDNDEITTTYTASDVIFTFGQPIRRAMVGDYLVLLY